MAILLYALLCICFSNPFSSLLFCMGFMLRGIFLLYIFGALCCVSVRSRDGFRWSSSKRAHARLTAAEYLYYISRPQSNGPNRFRYAIFRIGLQPECLLTHHQHHTSSLDRAGASIRLNFDWIVELPGNLNITKVVDVKLCIKFWNRLRWECDWKIVCFVWSAVCIGCCVVAIARAMWMSSVGQLNVLEDDSWFLWGCEFCWRLCGAMSVIQCIAVDCGGDEGIIELSRGIWGWLHVVFTLLIIGRKKWF